MTQRLISLILFLMLGLTINAQTKVFIPDTNFRNFLNSDYPSVMDGTGDSLVTAAAATVYGHFNCFFENIVDLTGVEHFINIGRLNCSNNLLTALPPLDRLINLNKLICNNNQITVLPALDSLINLEGLYCVNNQLTALPNLSNNTSLNSLSCDGNQLTILPDLSSNTFLAYLSCGFNQLSALPDLSANSTLYDVNCRFNQITELPDFSNTSLYKLNCSDNPLGTLPDLSPYTGLVSLHCNNNELTSLPDISSNTALKFLHCGGNQLTALPDLSSNLALAELFFSGNQLEYFPDLSAHLSMKYIHCEGNKLDFSDARELRIADTISTIIAHTFHPQAPFGSTDTFDLQPGDTLSLSIASQDSALSYQWFKGADAIAGATDTLLTIVNITTADSGIYTCESYGTALLNPPITHSPGANRFISQPKMVNVLTLAGVDLPDFRNLITVYPNPASGQITIKLNSASQEMAELKIFSLIGEQVYYEVISPNGKSYIQHLDISIFSKGIYLLTLTTDEGVYSQKLIVQ